jgi:hypothetical protein
MVILFLNEFSAFVKIKTSSEMLVDTNVGSDKLKINIDVSMKRLPCSILSLDSQDVMGTHSLNLHGKLVKNRLDKNGNVIGALAEHKVIAHRPGQEDQPDYEEVKRAVQNEEGCQLVGNIEVLRVPGNFHISSHAFGSTLTRLVTEGVYKFDISHTINHISFGDESDIKHIRSNFNVGILNPIDGVSKLKATEQKIYEYYLKVVPTSYTDVSGKTFNAHQFTANNNEVSSEMMIPTIFFRYDISPILIRIRQYKQGFFHFFIQICAIVGGIFTVMGILDNLLHKLTKGGKSE